MLSHRYDEAKGDGEPPAVPDELLKDRADHPELSVPDDHPRFSGYRLVDIARLDQFVSDHFCWADNAPTRQQDPLAKFVAWAVKKEYSANSRFARKLQELMTESASTSKTPELTPQTFVLSIPDRS